MDKGALFAIAAAVVLFGGITPVQNGCMAVRYFVHYGAIGNYPEGEVREFDRAALFAQFDRIRRTLTLGQ